MQLQAVLVAEAGLVRPLAGLDCWLAAEPSQGWYYSLILSLCFGFVGIS